MVNDYMDKLYKSQENIDELYDIIAEHIQEKFGIDIDDKYDAILQKAIEFVWSKVDHFPPKGISTDKYLEMMNIKTASLVINEIVQTLSAIPAQSKPQPQQSKPIQQQPVQQQMQKPEPLNPIPPPRITTRSSNADAPDINKEYSELIKKRDQDMPQPVQKPLQAPKPPSPDFQSLPEPPSQNQIVEKPILLPEKSVMLPEKPIPKQVIEKPPMPIRQEKKEESLILSSKQRDFSAGNVDNFVIKVNQKKDSQNKLIRISNSIICNIPAASQQSSKPTEFKYTSIKFNKLVIPSTAKHLAEHPYINLTFNGTDHQFIIDTKADNYIYFKSANKDPIAIGSTEQPELSFKITDSDGAAIDLPADKQSVKRIEPATERRIKIHCNTDGIAVGDRLYFYDSRPSNPTLLNFTSIDGKIKYTNFKVDIDKLIYKFSIMNSDKVSVSSVINFKSILPAATSAEQYLYLVYTRNGISRTEYLKIKDATPEHLLLETGLQNAIDIEINGIGFACKNTTGYQNGTRLFNEKGCQVLLIEEGTIIVDAIYDDTYAELKESGDVFFINRKNQVIIFSTASY